MPDLFAHTHTFLIVLFHRYINVTHQSDGEEAKKGKSLTLGRFD